MSDEILFHYELPDFTIETEEQHLLWVSRLVKHLQLAPECINFIFCDDEYLLAINKEYLDHDYYTDIITFPISEDPLMVDIFISVERVKENARDLKISFDNELRRVMSHGVLHITGLNDKTEEESLAMRKAEEEAMKLYQSDL